MVRSILERGKKIIGSQQTSLISAASVIMMAIITSRILGLVRQRVLAHFFSASDLSLFFAAFRLPDVIFEVLVFGTFSSAFIPVFTKAISKSPKKAWDLAGRVLSIGLSFFVLVAFIFGFFAKNVYHVISPGFDEAEIIRIASLARILFAAQGIFVASYVLTGVLESLRRFLVPALAPIFYNLGIILGVLLLPREFGLYAPVIGVVMGAVGHFLIQYPLSRKLGFRFKYNPKANKDVKKIGKLALPRVIDLSFDQLGKTTELFLASLISKASYTYYTFANTLQLIPVSLFGTSLAKAILPMLSRQTGDIREFKKTLSNAVYQAIFLTLPLAVLLLVLRVPIVRLVYGTDIFDWEATLQTGNVLVAFAFGITFQTLMSILSRSFFALHDTKTPVIVSFVGLFILIFLDFLLVLGFNYPIWALAASFSFSVFVETIVLTVLMIKRVGNIFHSDFWLRMSKIIFATLGSGFIMYFILKVFDKSVWVKKLSFISGIEATKYIPFNVFVLDTRYGFNLLVLTIITSIIGVSVYFSISYLLKVKEADYFVNLVKRLFKKKEAVTTIEIPLDKS